MTTYLFTPIRGIAWGCSRLVEELSLSAQNAGLTFRHGCTGLVHLALAVLNGSVDLLTVGSSPHVRLAAKQLEVGFGDSCSDVYLSALRILNPYATVRPRQGRSYPVTIGRFTDIETPLPLQLFSKYQQRSMNFLNHSRFTLIRSLTGIISPLSAVIGLIFGIVYLIFTLIGALLSAAFLGLATSLNSCVYEGFKTPGWMLNQLHIGILTLFRPDLV